MNFSEKLRSLRRERKINQAELAARVGVSPRSIASWEGGESYPRYKETYEALAKTLGVEVNYLRTEDDAVGHDAGQKYGIRGNQNVEEIIRKTTQLFAGGELSDLDKAAFMLEMQKIYMDSKIREHSYTPDPLLSPDHSEG